MEKLTFDVLKAAVSGPGLAFRSVVRLQPAGGAGDKIFPPTYAVAENARTKYATEERVIDGKKVATVLLDSVASQANRMELALLAAVEAEDLAIPVLNVSFEDQPELADLGRITTLEAPHRIADALFRDSLLGDMPFRLSAPGRAFTEATPKTATAVYRYCPTALVFGVWDSTGPKGGMGAKYPRAITSEIVGIGTALGVKTASRLDPAQIESSVTVYKHKDDPTDWTIDPTEAQQDGKKAVLYGRGAKGSGKPSELNHGNVAPSIETQAGGVTMEYAQQTTVLSLGALRRLRFPTSVDGESLSGAARRDAENAARTALTALGLAAMVYQRAEGYDLRSRCVLIPEGPLQIEILHGDGSPPATYGLSRAEASSLVSQAQAEAGKLGMAWDAQGLDLKPAPKLAALILKSRDRSRTAPADGDGEQA